MRQRLIFLKERLQSLLHFFSWLWRFFNLVKRSLQNQKSIMSFFVVFVFLHQWFILLNKTSAVVYFLLKTLYLLLMNFFKFFFQSSHLIILLYLLLLLLDCHLFIFKTQFLLKLQVHLFQSFFFLFKLQYLKVLVFGNLLHWFQMLFCFSFLLHFFVLMKILCVLIPLWLISYSGRQIT
jgi:hypothetical protein